MLQLGGDMTQSHLRPSEDGPTQSAGPQCLLYAPHPNPSLLRARLSLPVLDVGPLPVHTFGIPTPLPRCST